MYQTRRDRPHSNEFPQIVECTSQAMSGGCFQRVLDAACEAAEWLHQPLQFESAALRAVTRKVPTLR